MANITGINLAMQTPFLADGGINYARWEELIDIYIDTGVHGIVLGAGTGQHPYLTETECNRLFETGIKRIAGRCNVICQTSALNMDEVLRRSKHAQDQGADALMILPPYLEGPADDDGLFEFYAALDAQITADVIGYNIPQATGLSVSPALLKRLGQLDRFKYIKDSGGDLNVHQEYIQSAEGVQVLNGADPITVYALMAGSVGTIWGSANYMPRECVALWDLVQAGDLAGALVLWQKMLPSMLWMWSNDYIPAMKSATRLRGFDGGTVRAPLRPITPAAEAELAKSLAALDG